MNTEVKNYITGEVEEELYAETVTVGAGTTSPETVESGKIRDGYNAVAVSIAVSRVADCKFWLKINGKQHYPNGLGCEGLGAGQYLNNEVLLGVPLKEGDSWEIGFTNAGGADATISYRFRVRLFKK